MAMRLAFTKDSPLNTTLVDEASGLVMYEIETERRFTSKTTVIRKPFTSAQFFFFFVLFEGPIYRYYQIGADGLYLTPLLKLRGSGGRGGLLTESCITGVI